MWHVKVGRRSAVQAQDILDAAVANFGSVGYEHTKWATESVTDACVRLVP